MGIILPDMQALFLHAPYDEFMAAKGHHLKVLREAAGLSIRELARQIGQDHSNIRYWERTGNLPRSNLLIPMAQALGVTVEQLLGEDKPKRVLSPAGRMRQLFDQAAKLPRGKQEKIVAILEPFIREHISSSNG
jgi:transcriptional regulator with XRE-family HTH domain